jgi:cysteine synthase A
MICDSILDAIGNTPIIRLRNMTDEDSAEILVKYEGLGVGGSIKTRTAYSMITDAEERGLLDENSIIVEPTSGNQGIGLALIGAVRGYKVKIIMPDSVSPERRKLVRQYGAEVILVHDEGNIGLCIEKCIELAMKMKAEDPRVFVPGQFDNPANPRVQKNGTAREIIDEVGAPIHGFCSGIGTGGTITGIGEALKEKYPDIVVWAAEPERAAILSGGLIGTHVQMGIGDGIIPPILNRDIISDICIVTDDEAIAAAKKLAKCEGILCGISGGTNVASAIKLAKILGKGKTVVTVLPDTAERYFSTPLFDFDE